MLSSRVSHLQSTFQSQTNTLVEQMSDVEMKLRLANQTQRRTQLQLDSINTSSISAVHLLSSSLQSMQEEVGSKISSLDIAINYTKSATDLLLAKLSSVQTSKLTTTSKLSSLETQLNMTRIAVEMSQNQLTVLQAESAGERTSFTTRLNTTTAAIDRLTFQVSDLEAMLDTTNALLNSATDTITSLSHSQVSTRQALNTTNGNLTAVQARFSKMSSAFSSLNTSFTSPLRLYQACYRDKVNCTVHQHQITPYWYLCTTAALRINSPVSM